MADALGVDLAVTARVVSENGVPRAELVVVRRDRSVERSTHPLAAADIDAQAQRFHREIANVLGLPAPAGEAAGPAVEEALAGTPPAEALTTSATAPSSAAPAERPFVAPPSSGADDERRAGLANVRVVSWATAASGFVALGVGTVFFAKAKTTESEVEDAPARTESDLEELRSLEDRGDREKTTAGLFLTVGAVATLAGLGLIVWDSTRPTASTRLAVVPSDTADGITFALSGSF